MDKIENKSLWKEEMSFGGDTWYMGRTFEELKDYACVWVIPFAWLIESLMNFFILAPN